VTEGRDQGSVAFPDAPVKFYLDADPAVRARRRIEQLGLENEVSLDEMCRRIAHRDEVDSTRSDGPLICPEDAIVLDTSGLSIEGVIDAMERAVRERVAALIDLE